MPNGVSALVYVVALRRKDKDLPSEFKISDERFFHTVNDAEEYRMCLGDCKDYFSIFEANLEIIKMVDEK
jgi:hypothetical protein